MYNLLEYSKKYKKATGSFWNYYRDEPTNPLHSNYESFKEKTSITNMLIILGWWRTMLKVMVFCHLQKILVINMVKN